MSTFHCFCAAKTFYMRVFEKKYPLYSSGAWLISGISHTRGSAPYIRALLRVCRSCCKRAVSTLSQMLVLLVFFCFLVVLFSSPSRLSLKKKKEICILTLIKREKRRKNIKRGSEAASRSPASPTCGHVQPSPLRVRARACVRGSLLLRSDSLLVTQPAPLKMFNYESNEQLLSFPPPSLAILFPSAGSPEVDRVTGSGPGQTA